MKIKKILKRTALSSLLYGATILGSQEIHNYFSEPIKDKKDLGRILKEELDAIEFKYDKEISIFLSEKNSGVSRKLGENFYLIEIGGNQATRAVLRHELYHIIAGHFEKKYSLLKYIFYFEPTATLYQLFKLKI